MKLDENVPLLNTAVILLSICIICISCVHSDKSATDVDDRSEDEDSQPSPWRVCGNDEQTITEDSGHFLDDKEDSYSCEVCNRQFRWLQSFQRHLKAHSIFWCEECNREFCSRLNLQLPTDTEVISSYACEVCHVKFTRPGHLRQHVAQWHWRQKPYSCNRCAEGTASCDKFPQTAQQCPVCKHNFASYDYLRAHMKHHSKDKVYLCNTCNMQCFTLTMFKIHLETHKEEKRTAPKMYKRKSKPLKGLIISNY